MNNYISKTLVPLFIIFIVLGSVFIDRSKATADTGIQNSIKVWVDSAIITDQFMLTVAKIESNYRSHAVSPTGCKGLYQFCSATWGRMIDRFGKRENIDINEVLNPRSNTIMAVHLAELNYWALEEALGVAPHPYMVYMAHNIGVRGALRLLRAPKDVRVSKKLMGSKPRYNPKYLMHKGKPVTVGEALRRYEEDFKI